MRSRIIYSALGFGVGTLVGWAITADIYEKRTREERASYDEMIRDKTEHIWALQDRLDNPVVEVPQPEPERVQAEVPQVEAVEEPIDETVETTRSNLQSLIDMYTADEVAQSEFSQQVAVAVEQENSAPYVISREKYAYDEEGHYYSKITLYYYPDDRVLLDDDEEPIADVARHVGWRNLSRFGDESGDPGVVFVRNDKLESDFEIVREEDTPLPLHVKYGMEKEEFRANRAAGLIKLRQEDE